MEELNKIHKTWKEIEEEFRKKFDVVINKQWGRMVFPCEGGYCEESPEDILAFFKPYFQEELHELAKQELESTNYVQIGDTVACGHCRPNEKYKLLEEYGLVCNCKCHNVKPESSWEERFDAVPNQLCECRHNGSAYGDIYCDECGNNNCKNCVKIPFKDFISKVEKEAYERGLEDRKQKEWEIMKGF